MRQARSYLRADQPGEKAVAVQEVEHLVEYEYLSTEAQLQSLDMGGNYRWESRPVLDIPDVPQIHVEEHYQLPAVCPLVLVIRFNL